MRGKKRYAQNKRKRQHYISPLFDDHGYPHPGDEWESLLPDVKEGRLIRKRKHSAPNLTSIDHNFGEEFDESKHGNMLRSDLKISHLTPAQQSALTSVVKRYWHVVSKKGVTTPVKDYVCEIDTGSARPI